MADDKLIFDPNKCDVAPVTRIPCEQLLTDDSIPDTPDESRDMPACDAVQPLSPEPPCPVLNQPTVRIVEGATTAIKFTITKGACCEYDFDLEIDVRVLCPDIQPIHVERRTIGFIPGPLGLLTYYFVKGEDCSFDLEIDITVPCPDITPNDGGGGEIKKDVHFSPTNPGTLRFMFTKGPDCDYDLDIDIDVPCPQIQPQTPITKPVNFAATNPGTLTYKFTKGDDCDYDLDIDIDVPCPDIQPQEVVTKLVSFALSGSGTLSYVFTKGDNCDYDLDIDIDVPCPDINPVVWTTTTMTPAAGTPQIRFRFNKGTDCDYDLEIEAEYTCPKMLPDSLDPRTVLVPFLPRDDLKGELKFFFTKSPDCEFDLTLDLQVPCPQIKPITKRTTTLVQIDQGQPKLNWQFTKSDNCQYDLNIDGEFLCPPIKPQVPVTITRLLDTVDTITFQFVKSDNCAYELTMSGTYASGCPIMLPLVGTSPLDLGDSSIGYIDYNFTKSANCTWTLDIQGQAPCPTINPQGINFSALVPVAGRAPDIYWRFAKAAGCSYTLTIFGEYACTVVTPAIITVYALNQVNADPEIRYAFSKGIGCAYDLLIEGDYLCPPITPIETETTLLQLVPPGVTPVINWRFLKTPECAYDLVIWGTYQAGGCPAMLPILATTAEITFTPSSSSQLTYYFVKDTATPCTWTLNIPDFKVPCPKVNPLSPTNRVMQATTTAGGNGYIEWQFLKDPSSCIYTLYLTAEGPCSDIQPRSATTTTLVLTTSTPTITWHFDKTPNCNYTLVITGTYKAGDCTQPVGCTGSVCDATTLPGFSTGVVQVLVKGSDDCWSLVDVDTCS